MCNLVMIKLEVVRWILICLGLNIFNVWFTFKDSFLLLNQVEEEESRGKGLRKDALMLLFIVLIYNV